MSTDNSISIIGGGAAGLAIAYFAEKSGLSYQCHEASSELGGNARTIWKEIHGEKFGWDTGAHRLHGVDDDMLSVFKEILGEDMHQIYSKSKMWYNESYLDFPFHPSNFLSNVGISRGASFFLDFLFTSFFKKSQEENFESFMRSSFGDKIAENFFLNYSEKLWGIPCSQLSATVSGSRLKKWTPLDIFKELMGINSRHMEGSFYYPTNGIGDLWNKLLSLIQKDRIHTNDPVQQIIHNNKRITELHFSCRSETVSTLVSTIDLKTFVQLLRPAPPEYILNGVEQIRYRNLRLAVLYLDQPSFTKFPSLYFPGKNFSFTRIYEPKIRSKALAPSDKTAIVVESPRYDEDEAGFLTDLVQELVENNILSRDAIIDQEELYLPNAYPVLSHSSNAALQTVLEYLRQFDNLELCGRSSEFKYCHIHDHFDNSQRIIKKISEKTI